MFTERGKSVNAEQKPTTDDGCGAGSPDDETVQLVAQSTVTIDRTAAEVYAYAADLTNFAEWFPGVVAIHGEDTLAPHEPGKRYRETVKLSPLGPRRAISITVKAATQGQQLVTEGAFPPLWPRMEIVVTPEGTDDRPSARVSWRMVSRSRSSLFIRLLLPLVRKMMQKRATVAMTRLRKALELGARA